jgi:hypothetical protein
MYYLLETAKAKALGCLSENETTLPEWSTNWTLMWQVGEVARGGKIETLLSTGIGQQK